MTTASMQSPGSVSGAQALAVLQRVVLPLRSQLDTAPLYVDAGTAWGPGLDTVTSRTGPGPGHAGPSGVAAHVEDFRSRRSLDVRPGERLSFASYFNAFPASYWRRWTDLTSVRLRIKTSGEGTIIVLKSNARGALQRVTSVSTSGREVFDFDLSLAPFGDGGWYWFDLVGGSEAFRLEEAVWLGKDCARPQGMVTLQFTTMDKPEFCIRNLRTLGDHPKVLEHLQEIIIVDQGTKKVAEEREFEEVAARLGGRLRVIHQANLGGSGGFSRGMFEAVRNGSDYVLLMDDDIEMEPESIVRLLTFSRFCRQPTLVGGHMFDLYNRTTLHTLGESVNMWRFQPGKPLDDQVTGHDLATDSLRNTSWMHRRIDVDYNGWWMELIPTEVIRQIGLALPVFIKWDDVEYGLRAKAAGFPTVSLPGAAVWHISWGDKDDLVGWQAYFHERNRVIAALLHSPYDRGGRLIRESLYMDVKHLISMQYYTEAGRIMALQDILAGPDLLHRIQPERILQIRALAQDYSDARFRPRLDDFPAPKVMKPPKRGRVLTQPSVAGLAPWAAKTVLRQIVRPTRASSRSNPQALVAHIDNKWWRMSQFDSAVVSNAEGTAASWYQRDPRQVREKLRTAAVLHSELLRRWTQLRRQYREAAPRITSWEAWAETFDRHTHSELRR